MPPAISNTAMAASVTKNPPISFCGIFLDSPKRSDNAHTHSADSWKQTADEAHEQRGAKTQHKYRFAEDQAGKQTVQRRTESRDGKNGQAEAEQTADQGDNQRFAENEEQHSGIRETD